jgi:hypothetical protein
LKTRLLQLIERLDERQLRLVLAFVLGLLR